MHNTQPAHSHIHDYEGHVEAVEADLEYWRTKRLEPSVLQLHRRGVLTLYDLIDAAARLPAGPVSADEDLRDLEGRIRALEDGLNEYVRGIGLVSLETLVDISTDLIEVHKAPRRIGRSTATHSAVTPMVARQAQGQATQGRLIHFPTFTALRTHESLQS
jgi:hypothetical protein